MEKTMEKTHEILLAGFGGQGILFAGKVLVYGGMMNALEVSWLPSYGPEMRGGTCNCSIIISDEPIGSPLVVDPGVLVALNRPSLDKFEARVKEGGYILYDSSLIDREITREDVSVVAIPATKMAEELGLKGLANMLMVGALIKAIGCFSLSDMEKAIQKVVPASKAALIEKNIEAVRAGYNYEN